MSVLNDAQLLQLLDEDVPYGDLTSRNLSLQACQARMDFSARYAMQLSGVEEAARLLTLLGCRVETQVASGDAAAAGQPLLQAWGSALNLLSGWKVSQNLMEWASGISSCAAAICTAARAADPRVVVACTRKAVPGTRRLSVKAVVDGGAQIHRTGLSETLLLFPEHRALGSGEAILAQQIQQLKQRCPERRLVVEVTSVDEGIAAAAAGAEVIQAEKFALADLQQLAQTLQAFPGVHLAAAGGINPANAADYVQAGALILVTSAPYTAPPKDVSVRLEKTQ